MTKRTSVMGRGSSASLAIGLLCCAVALFGRCALNDSAQTLYWTGAQDSLWTNASNWATSDGAVPATAPGVAGTLSEPSSWRGHKLDAAVFDGARFANASSLTLDVQGLLCVGYVTVQGASTPSISFGTGRYDAQCFHLYSSGVDGEAGVFTVAADVENMPIIPYPALAGLFDNGTTKAGYLRFVNNAAGKTFTFLSCARETKDPGASLSGNPTANIYFGGEGNFSLGGAYAGKASGGLSSLGQRFLTFELFGGSSLMVTNFTSNMARINIYGRGDDEHVVTIAAGSKICTNNRGYEQLHVGGRLAVVGEGTLAICDQGDKSNLPMKVAATNTHVKIDARFFFGASSDTAPSVQALKARPTSPNGSGSTIELNNPGNVICGGITLEGLNLVSSSVDRDSSAIGGGMVTINGRYGFIYTGTSDVAVMTNVLHFGWYETLRQIGGTIRHSGSGRLALAGGVTFDSRGESNTGFVEAEREDSEIEIFGGFDDPTTSTANGLGCTFCGLGRIILHDEYKFTHWLNFGAGDANAVPLITVAEDASFTPIKAGASICFRRADVTFQGASEGAMETLAIPAVSLYEGANTIRLKGRRSVRFASITTRQSAFRAALYRESPDQQIWFVGADYAPAKGSQSYMSMNDYAAVEFNLDGSVRPYSTYCWTGIGIPSNGGVITNAPGGYVALSQDGTAAEGDVTVEGSGVSVGRLAQKGLRPAVIALGAGQRISSTAVVLDVDAGDMTVGDVVGRGAIYLSDGTICNYDTNSVLYMNAGIEVPSGKSITFKGIGQIDVNSVIGGANKLVVDGTATVTLNAVNDYTETTYVEKGTLRLGVDDAISASSKITLGPGGRLDLNDHGISNPDRIVLSGGSVVNDSGRWTFTADRTNDFSPFGVAPSPGDVVVVANAAAVASRNRSRYWLARFASDVADVPSLSAESQAVLGDEWSVVAEGPSLFLVGPRRGMRIIMR